jgi:hypothetical protein
LEEVLVVTKIDERQAQPEQAGGARAIDILASRLPSVPSKPDATDKAASPNGATAGGVATKTPTNGAAAAGGAKTAHPVTPDANAQSKPKAAPPDAATGNGAPAARSAPSADSPARDSSGPPSASKSTATTLSSAPVKKVTDPKPQADSPDTPH